MMKINSLMKRIKKELNYNRSDDFLSLDVQQLLFKSGKELI